MTFPIISADSHITEAPNTYVDYIDAKWRDKAPHIVDAGEKGDLYVIDGMKSTISMGLVAAAGKKPEELTLVGTRFDDLHKGGWDPEARMADQDTDGVSAEVIYPTVGMVVTNHPDFEYKKACFDAYNRWLAEYCSAHPDRLLGCGQTAMGTPEEGVADLHAIKAAGLRGAMMPNIPAMEDYDSEIYNPVWEAAIELGLPLSFHIVPARDPNQRGSRLNGFLGVIRQNQDIIGTMIYGGVFERYPALKVVCVEADAGWVPHYMYRMDHAYERHRNWMAPGVELSKMPSEYFSEHVYTTFQDDYVAFQSANQMNWRRLLWASDFPHSDSTWPWSQDVLTKQTVGLKPEQLEAILSGNVAELYGVDRETLAPTHRLAS